MTKTSTVLAAVLAVAVAATGTAQARDGISPGAAAALGVLGGVAVGGALAAQQRDDGYYPGRRIYAAPPPVEEVVVRRRVVVEEEPVCHFERRRYVNDYNGDVLIKRVRVCD